MPKSSDGSSKKPPHRPWKDPDDAPELTNDMLDRAEIIVDGRIVQPGRPPLGIKPSRS
jgi:hypothetical protein